MSYDKNMMTEKSVSRSKPLTRDEIDWALEEIERLVNYSGDLHIGYQFRDTIIPRLNQLIKARLVQFVSQSNYVFVKVDGKWAEEIQQRGFHMEINIYGVVAAKALRLHEAKEFFLDDSCARSVTHSMISRAAIVRWGR